MIRFLCLCVDYALKCEGSVSPSQSRFALHSGVTSRHTLFLASARM